MIKNMGSLDRILRVGIAVVVAVLYFMEIITGTVAIAMLVIGAVMLATSLIGSCPLYIPFKLNTKQGNK
ncbi:MAG: DUF2892 domain-containing protein [Leptospira sp.]|nr:DUF2892 domain-containing protein [Leptospira sp.]